MRNPIDQFLADAKKVILRKKERKDLRNIIFSQKLSSVASKIELTKKEFSLGRKAFKSYMRLFKIEKISFVDVMQSLINIRFVSISLIVIFLVSSIGGGVAYAAEDSLPGDLLYHVKINVTEPLRENMRFNPDIRARWAEKRIKRRLKEIELLLSKNQITDKKLGMLDNMINMHQKNFEIKVQDLPKEITEEIREHLRMRMIEHWKFLEGLEKDKISILQNKNPKFRSHIKMHKMHVKMMGRALPMGNI